MNQWKNTYHVINWFKNIKNKTDHTMICFDICDFYPSITNTLLQKALKFASKYPTISKEDIDIITHTKRTTLYKDGQPWEKITSKFNVTMASYDGAEICELDMRISRSLSPLANARSKHKYRTFQTRRAGHNEANPKRSRNDEEKAMQNLQGK